MAALAFGPIHNITTKSLELVQVGHQSRKNYNSYFSARGGGERTFGKAFGQVEVSSSQEASCRCQEGGGGGEQ